MTDVPACLRNHSYAIGIANDGVVYCGSDRAWAIQALWTAVTVTGREALIVAEHQGGEFCRTEAESLQVQVVTFEALLAVPSWSGEVEAGALCAAAREAVSTIAGDGRGFLRTHAQECPCPFKVVAGARS